MLWVVDGYTTSDQYPYSQDADLSQLSGGSGLQLPFNYVRNSVKAVVDAYDGSVTMYAVDTQDPILRAWRGAFPKLFVDASKMPEGLVAHLRYPEDLFRIQTAAYSKYKLSPEEFFGRKGAWSVAQAPADIPQLKSSTPAAGSVAAEDTGSQGLSQDSTTQRFVPYYTMFHAPNSTEDPQFSLFRPFVPYSGDDSRTELQSFMVASSDPATYGKLTVYEVQNKTDGPVLVANNAESNGVISKRITELNQQGSQVRFGDLQAVPIASGLLYVRPFYVVKEQAEYQFVIVSYNSVAVIDSSLTGAIKQLFPGFNTEIGERSGVAPPTSEPGTGPATEGDTPAELLQKAQDLFAEADAALNNGPAGLAEFAAKQAQARVLLAQALAALTP